MVVTEICTMIAVRKIQSGTMQIHFIKNVQFTKLIKAEGRLREFNFRKINSSAELVFTIDVSDDRGNRIMIRMHKPANLWTIMPQVLPAWLTQLEPTFHQLIEEAVNE
jgi:hypothetical protein